MICPKCLVDCEPDLAVNPQDTGDNEDAYRCPKCNEQYTEEDSDTEQ